MTSAPHPLPAAVGRTERALSAVLLAALEGTLVAGSDEWVALNALAGGPDDPDAAVRTALRDAPDRGRATLGALRGKGLVDGDGRLTDDGRAAVAQVRSRVAPATHRLVEGLPEADVATTVRVLDAVRERAASAS
ncbi:MAG: hypothetical protein HY830_18155 [Actinobacteria bacterium]|nr:hypothetical protein [Actinomycetota bacterium]